MKTDKCEVMLIRNGRCVAIAVLYMDERFRGTGLRVPTFTASNGIKIKSSLWPAIDADNDVLYLRGGERESDDSINADMFLNNDAARSFVDRAITALHEWSINWDGWEHESQHDTDFEVH